MTHRMEGTYVVPRAAESANRESRRASAVATLPRRPAVQRRALARVGPRCTRADSRLSGCIVPPRAALHAHGTGGRAVGHCG